MAEQAATILVATPDQEMAALLDDVLSSSYYIRRTNDGPGAIEHLLQSPPELMIYDCACPTMDVRQLADIIPNLPKGTETGVVYLIDEEDEPPPGTSVLHMAIRKPFNGDEFKSWVMNLLERRDVVCHPERRERILTGSFEHLPLPDLLQVLAMNRRSGRLLVSSEEEDYEGECYFDKGNLVEVILGPARGRKGLYRLLGWREGDFCFEAMYAAPSESISGSMDRIIMEGLQEVDEIRHRAPELPGYDAQVIAVAERQEDAQPLPPAAQELMALSSLYQRVGELLDNSELTDLTFFTTLEALVSSGYLKVLDGTAVLPTRLVTPAVIADLNARVAQSPLPDCYKASPNLVILVADSDDLAQVARWFGEVREFVSEDNNLERLSTGMGKMGFIRLGMATKLSVLVHVAKPSTMPLLSLGSAGTIAGLVVAEDDGPLMNARTLVEARSLLRRQRGLELAGLEQVNSAGFRTALSKAIRQGSSFVF